MHKPLLIYNGKDYLGMCTNAEFFDSLCPISYDKMTFIDAIVDETILDITYSPNITSFNSYIESTFQMAVDVKLSHSRAYCVNDFFSIELHDSQVLYDGMDSYCNEYYFNDLEHYITHHETHSVFDLESFLSDFSCNNTYRVFIIINIPCIVLHRNENVYRSLNTFFPDSVLKNFKYELGSGMYALEFKTYYMNPQRDNIDMLIKEVDEYNQISNSKIFMTVNNNDDPIIRNIGEIHVTMSFEPENFKKQLFFVFVRIKALIDNDMTFKLYA